MPLRDGIGTFLLASQLTLVNMDQANATFAKAREMEKALPEPSATYHEVRERSQRRQALGPLLLPHLAAARPTRQRRPSARAAARRRQSFCSTAMKIP